MAYELVRSGNTQFAIDWSVVRRLVRSYYLSYYQLSYASEVTLSDSHWYNPLSWSLPDVTNLEVDWDAVRRQTDADTDSEIQEMTGQAVRDAAGVAYRVEAMIDDAARRKEGYLNWMGDLQTDNMKKINQAVNDYESHVEIAQFVRNASADGLMVGASVMSGGAAVAVMGAGSTLKGTAKFQDTGSVGAAVMEGVGSFAFAFVKLGKSFSFKQDMILALVQAPYKAGTELVGGASVGKALLSGGLKLTGPAVNQLFNLSPVKTLFDRIAMPISIWQKTIDEPGHGQSLNVADEILRKFAKERAQKRGIEGAGKNAILRTGSSSSSAPNRQGSSRQGAVLAEATLTSKFLLYLAFVNMNEGVGRGW
jgi:hypothetical protein